MDTEHDSPGVFQRLLARFKNAASAGLLRRFNIPGGAARNLSSFIKLTGPTTGGFPTELLPLGASMWSGFILTPFAQQQMEGWVLPFWLRRQSLPSSGSFVPHGHSFLYSNMTHRNWTGVGLPGFPNEGTVDPKGLVTPWPFGPSVDVWVLKDGDLYCPSEIDGVGQRLIDDLPLVETTFDARRLRCTLTTFVAPLDGMPVVLGVARLENDTDTAARASLVISARPYNNESICAVNHLSYDPAGHMFTADGSPLLYVAAEPDRVLLSDYAHGDVARQLREDIGERLPDGTLEVTEPIGLATGAAVFHREIEPASSAIVCFACPLSAGVHPELDKMLPVEGAPDTILGKLDEQRGKWADIASSGTRVSFPEERYQKAFDVNKTFLLLMYDGQSITPGVSTYHMMWFRDAAYLVPALERLGHPEMARRILLTYPDRQTREGFFRSHNGEWDSCGQAMWTLVNHYRMTGDSDFLRDVYPSLMKGARWIDSMRRTDLPMDDPKRGLLPEGISAEHFGISDCYYWDDLWSVGGLRAAALAARDLGFEQDARYAGSLADEIMGDLESSWETVAKRLGRTVMPIAPYRDVDAASIGALAAVYPLDLIGPEEEIIAGTVGELVERCFYRDTHYHGVMHCGINPYLSMHVAQYYLRRRDPYALKIFESLIEMATETYTFPEAINPLTGGGSFGDGHDGWSAGDIFNFVRNLLVMEERDKLVLIPVAREEWFAAGERIEVKGAPTYFGVVSYLIESKDEYIEFTLPGNLERPPAAVELNVPFTITSCEVDGETFDVPESSTSVDVPPSAKKVLLGIRRS
ncbi:MAG: hypothetical protein KKB90_03355 [Actinobacteria bacterium]|nr:hypothetical protein [Actinomycetota bacterium]MCG2819557.1 hypothetical protein [Actinomycetes bacterium]MBU4217982.1 hypothetical protein [Actinomycetota bacterium]MBU4358247.1 hypothetical protein [Actinomycetota bacterium]MBU4391211.1 hypothetical protein [Actinomycetota bacterium]